VRGRGDAVAVVDHPLVDHRSDERTELVEGVAVGGAVPVGEQASGGEQHPAGTDGREPAHRRRGLDEFRRERPPLSLRPRAFGRSVEPAAAGDDHTVRGTQRRRDVEAHAALAHDGARFLDAHQGDVEAGAGQHLERPERIDLVEPVEHHDLDLHVDQRRRSRGSGASGRAARVRANPANLGSARKEQLYRDASDLPERATR